MHFDLDTGFNIENLNIEYRPLNLRPFFEPVAVAYFTVSCIAIIMGQIQDGRRILHNVNEKKKRE